MCECIHVRICILIHEHLLTFLTSIRLLETGSAFPEMPGWFPEVG